MSMPLAEALEQVDLNPGSIYCCQVKGRWVEVRVLDQPPPQLAKPFTESDVMLDPWFELPDIAANHRQTVTRRVRLPFDVPEIPSE